MCRPVHYFNVLLPLVMLTGCQPTDAPAPLIATTKPSLQQPRATPSPEKVLPPTTGKPLAEALASYEPPFPNRNDLFVPPQRTPAAANLSVNQASVSVEIKGFVDVGAPTVLLEMAGVISQLAVGEEKYGVQVVAIQQPEVQLKQNGTTWTLRFE